MIVQMVGATADCKTGVGTLKFLQLESGDEQMRLVIESRASWDVSIPDGPGGLLSDAESA